MQGSRQQWSYPTSAGIVQSLLFSMHVRKVAMPNDSGVPTFQSVVEAQGLPKTCADGPLSKQFVLIIGASRSGSSWLQYMLSRPKQVCTSVELAIFSDYVAPWVAAWNVEISNRSKLGYDRGLPYLWSEQQLHEFLTLFLDRETGRWYTQRGRRRRWRTVHRQARLWRGHLQRSGGTLA